MNGVPVLLFRGALCNQLADRRRHGIRRDDEAEVIDFESILIVAHALVADDSGHRDPVQKADDTDEDGGCSENAALHEEIIFTG